MGKHIVTAGAVCTTQTGTSDSYPYVYTYVDANIIITPDTTGMVAAHDYALISGLPTQDPP